MSVFSDWCRGWSRHLLFPVAKLLQRVGLSPNGVSILGCSFYLLSGVLLGLGHPFASGLILAILGPLDAVDGLLARETGRVTRFGAFLDSSLDRVAEFFLFSGALFYLDSIGSLGVVNAFLILSAMTGSLLVSYTRARAEALGFSCKIGLFTRFERLFLFALGLLFGFLVQVLWILSILTFVTAFQRMIHVWRQSRHEK